MKRSRLFGGLIFVIFAILPLINSILFYNRLPSLHFGRLPFSILPLTWFSWPLILPDAANFLIGAALAILGYKFSASQKGRVFVCVLLAFVVTLTAFSYYQSSLFKN